MKDRIKAVRLDAGLTQKAFAERINVRSNYVYILETGRGAASPAVVREICRQFAVREQWLRTGEGDMHYNTTPALDAADRVRRLMVDHPESTAAAVVSALVSLDPLGPEWEMIGGLLQSIQAHKAG